MIVICDLIVRMYSIRRIRICEIVCLISYKEGGDVLFCRIAALGKRRRQICAKITTIRKKIPAEIYNNSILILFYYFIKHLAGECKRKETDSPVRLIIF